MFVELDPNAVILLLAPVLLPFFSVPIAVAAEALE